MRGRNVEKVIEYLQKAHDWIERVGPDHCETTMRHSLYGSMDLIKAVIAELKSPPRCETPEQWKERTGEVWPDNWAVYTKRKSGGAPWIIQSYHEAKILDRWIPTTIICATEAGRPPDGWVPEDKNATE
jgi:hypothetical protein